MSNKEKNQKTMKIVLTVAEKLPNYQKFKALCYLNGRDMKSVLTEMINKYVEKGGI